MASIAISGASSSNALQTAPKAVQVQVQAPADAHNTAILKPDTVKLSAAGMAKMMHRSGQSPALIAAALGTSVASVDGYLGIKVAVQATASAAATATPATTTAPAASTAVHEGSEAATQAATPAAKAATPATAAATVPAKG